MDASDSIPAAPTKRIPTGPTFAEEMASFYRLTGITPPTDEEIANSPPWTEEEAAAFERAINESCEQVNEVPEWP